MDSDEELEAIRKRKMEQLRLQQQAAQQQADEEEYLEEQIKAIMRQILEPTARERMARIKMVKPQVAAAVEQQLISLAQSGQLRKKIDDATLVKMLDRLMPKKRDINITRK